MWTLFRQIPPPLLFNPPNTQANELEREEKAKKGNISS
jgi:hypothetical protein